MDYNTLYRSILSVYKKCNIHSFPIDCFNILQQYGYVIKKYSELSEIKRDACMILSEDACVIDKTIFYNDKMIDGRIRFSLMHELGHIVLNTESEKDANCFASHILVPRMAIHYAKCKNHTDVSKVFKTTKEASKLAYNDYISWLQHKLRYKLSYVDKQFYEHFYSDRFKKFVYKQSLCVYCDRNIINSTSYICQVCNARYMSYDFEIVK